MRIIKLEAENIKRLKAITIRPTGAATLIGGRNAQGKSSTLDCIAMALSGKAIPEQPIRVGSKKGHIVLETDELLIERTFSAKGSKLVVRNKAGIEQRSPQSLLDSLFGSLAFDPFKFSQDKPKQQAETIRKLAGLDFSALDEERQAAFDQRTEANRETKRLAAVLESLPADVDGVPATEVSVEELKVELSERNAQATKKAKLSAAVVEASKEATRAKERHEGAEDRLALMEKEVQTQKELIASLRAKLLFQEEAEAKATQEADAFTPDPVEETLEKLSALEETNRKVRANTERVSVRRKLSDSEDLAEELTEQIEEVDARKAALIESAKLPVPGLAFDEDGPTLNGIALSQCSQAERLRVSVAVGLAFNPKLRVMLIREGAFLDEDALALLAELAEQADAQVFIERVGTADEAAIIIEDGMVAESEERGAAE